jgi:hypothetical protein
MSGPLFVRQQWVVVIPEAIEKVIQHLAVQFSATNGINFLQGRPSCTQHSIIAWVLGRNITDQGPDPIDLSHPE